MADDVSDIRAFYDAAVERENIRLERHQIERDITWRYLDKYLPRRGKILEVGAATGAYTITLAKRGYNLTAVDLSPNSIAACEKRAAKEGLSRNVTCLVADARDLGAVQGVDYDAVLIMGPLYHLVVEEDRQTALKEAYKKLKKGGVIFSTFISRYGIWGDIMKDFPHYIERQKDLQSVMSKGRDADIVWGKSFRGYFATVDEVIPLHERLGFKTLTLAGIEPGRVRDEVYNELKGQRREQWLDLLFSISTEKSIIGAANHLLYIGVKEG
ncbi:MAG: class I SAM-dependent methyltransferase [Dehalococcoidales bacterium]